MPHGGAHIINGIPITARDKNVWVEKITAGYFPGNQGKLTSGNIYTASLSSTNESYYYGIAKENPTGSVCFHVAYGNLNGYGSDTDGGGIPGKTKAIYKQWAQTLLAPAEVTGGLFISRNKSLSSVPSSATVASGPDEEVYVVLADRGLMKDRLNKKNWTIELSGSMSSLNIDNLTGSNPLHLTDDSADVTATSTPAGPRYNVISGSQGTAATSQGASVRTFGFFYPDQGLILLSGAELSASIPGNFRSASGAAKYLDTSLASDKAFDGFGTTTNVDTDYNNALRFINCLKPTGGYLQFRSEEDETSVSYFCRVHSTEANFSNNPTFISGSQNELRQKTHRGNPSVYITGVQLYDGSGNIVASGQLSTPLKKNFASEATIKVKLTF